MPEYILRADHVEAVQFTGESQEEDEKVVAWVIEFGGKADIILPRKELRFETWDAGNVAEGHGPQLLLKYQQKAIGKTVTEILEVGEWILKHPGFGWGYFETKSDRMFKSLYAPTEPLELLREKLTEPSDGI